MSRRQTVAIANEERAKVCHAFYHRSGRYQIHNEVVRGVGADPDISDKTRPLVSDDSVLR